MEQFNKAYISPNLMAFNRIYQSFVGIYHDIALELGLSDSGFVILYTICETGDGCLQKDLSTMLSMSKQTINSSIRRLEKDDFLTTTPYEALYAYHKEPFTHAAKMEELAAYSVSKGFKGFKTMYKKYVESLKAQSGTIYIDNVTNFTNQPLELNAGDWEADDSGIFKKKRS